MADKEKQLSDAKTLIRNSVPVPEKEKDDFIKSLLKVEPLVDKNGKTIGAVTWMHIEWDEYKDRNGKGDKPSTSPSVVQLIINDSKNIAVLKAADRKNGQDPDEKRNEVTIVDAEDEDKAISNTVKLPANYFTAQKDLGVHLTGASGYDKKGYFPTVLNKGQFAIKTFAGGGGRSKNQYEFSLDNGANLDISASRAFMTDTLRIIAGSNDGTKIPSVTVTPNSLRGMVVPDNFAWRVQIPARGIELRLEPKSKLTVNTADGKKLQIDDHFTPGQIEELERYKNSKPPQEKKPQAMNVIDVPGDYMPSSRTSLPVLPPKPRFLS